MNVYHYVDTTRANADGMFPVYIVVKNNAGRFFVNTDLTASGKLTGMVFPKKDDNAREKTMLLCKYLAEVERVCLQSEVAGLANRELKGKIQEVVFGIEPKRPLETLVRCMGAFADTKREGTRKNYLYAIKRLQAFDAKCRLEEVDAAWLERFKKWMIGNGAKVNGAGGLLREIRAVFNWARKQGLTTNYPFMDYSIEEEETVPNNISVEQLRMLRDYPCELWQVKYRDFFMLSFYMAGMNPVDLLMLKSDAVRDGHVTFVRQKTNKQGQKKMRTVTLPVVVEARAIMERYKGSDGWLLSFMDGRSDYHSFLKKCNEALKKIGTHEIVPDKLGKRRKVAYHPILPKITMYTARYTFGSIAANDLDISERTIGQCLGHSWARNVTCRYMANDQRKVDAAVRRVVDYVNSDEVADYTWH